MADELGKWDKLSSWLGEKNVVLHIDATEYEEWGSDDRVNTPTIVIEYGDYAVAIDVIPLRGEKYLDVEVMPFKDGVLDDSAKMFGMSRDRPWSEHLVPEGVPVEGIKFPHFAILVGQPDE
jgi:hypothetical protein